MYVSKHQVQLSAAARYLGSAGNFGGILEVHVDLQLRITHVGLTALSEEAR